MEEVAREAHLYLCVGVGEAGGECYVDRYDRWYI